jgi:hypothetical protein
MLGGYFTPIQKSTQNKFSNFICNMYFKDEENIPQKAVVAVAGKSLLLPCPGVNEDSLVDTLTWKTNQIIAKYVHGVPWMLDSRVSKLNIIVIAATKDYSLQISVHSDSYSLYFNKTKYSDTGEYSCIVNDRHSPESIIDLLIQGKFLT